MIEEVQELEVEVLPAGPKGLSAYDIYVKNGGTLSEKEWLESLKGLTPTIGDNGNWYLGDKDTGLPSRGLKGDPGSIKFIVATELPTENIDETAIYIIPYSDPKDANKYEEFIYVDNKWESLGVPQIEVDLTNYYTKEEIGALTNLSTEDKSSIVNAINEVASSGGITELTDETIDLRTLDKGVYIVLSSVKKIKCGSYSGTIFDIGLLTNHTKDRILLVGTSGTTYNTGYLFAGSKIVYLMGFGSGKESYIITSMYSLSEVLPKDNTKSYTPTSDYNPSTKKYVDDKTGDLTTLVTEDKTSLVNAINEVVSSSGSEILTNYTSGNKEIAQKAIDAMKKGKQVIIIKKPNSNSGNNGDYGPMYVCSPTLSVSEDYTGTVYFKSNYFMSIGYNNYNSTKELEYLPYFYQLTIRVTNGVVTSAGDISSTSNYNSYRPIPVLSKENKSAYTPTSDYNPATKKYVDDAIASAITTSLEASY